MASAEHGQVTPGHAPIGPKRKSKPKRQPANDKQQLRTPKSTLKSRMSALTFDNQQRDDEDEESSQSSDDDTEEDEDDDDMGAGGDGGNLETFLTKNIPSMASATRVDAVTKKRTYVTKTNKEWTVDLKPLYKQLELMARKALLITCDKSLMQHCIDFCFSSFTGIESQWILDLAARRFRVNCNSWKSRYLRCVKSYIQKLDEKESVLRSCDSNHDLQVYFSERFTVDMFYTVCSWASGWIDLESSIRIHPEVKVWCAYIFTEICVCIKHHLNWQRAYNSGKEIKKTQWDWPFVLNRFDNLYAGADTAWSNYKIKQLNWLHNASKANKITLRKEDRPVLQPKDDEYALKPDSKFLAALQYAPRSPTPPSQEQIKNPRNNARKRGRRNERDDDKPNATQNQKRRKTTSAREPTDKSQVGGISNGEENESQSQDVRSRSRDSTIRASNSNVTSQNSQNLSNRDNGSRSQATNIKGGNPHVQDILGKENQRVTNMLKKRNYNTHSNGHGPTDEQDEYDNDELYDSDKRLNDNYDDDDIDDDDDDGHLHTDSDDEPGHSEAEA
ncbi:hypothetical protein F4861DRAFT_543647 [Xylaria intraflava]|nr:hypothetical protein F4861DRAFT_543647 [Xylaria intraflava]